ncbi:MAG TPA: hypothetical protein VD794_16510 [Flavisolibacter sp.]|nr:hypothetical protein [Flavisolibacter sp.]
MKVLRFALLLTGATLFFAACKKDDKPKPPTDLTPEDFVYYTSNDTVYRVKATGGTPEMLFNGTDDANGAFKNNEITDIAIDRTSGKLVLQTHYKVSFTYIDVVFVGNRDGSGSLTKIVDGKSNGTFSTTDAIDFYGLTAANGKVYIECDDKFIGVVNIDGTSPAKLHENVEANLDGWLYTDLEVDPSTNTLFSLGDTAVWKIGFAANSTPSNIASNKTTTDNFFGYRMTFRKATEELFFIDNEFNRIYKAKTNGTGYNRLYSLDGEGKAIAVDETSGDLYFSEDNKIQKYTLASSKSTVSTAYTNPGALAYY